jgi:hypothetical protein
LVRKAGNLLTESLPPQNSGFPDFLKSDNKILSQFTRCNL